MAKRKKGFKYVFEKDGRIYRFKTQTQIAEYLGITQQAISLRICGGETLSEIFRAKGENIAHQKRTRRRRTRKQLNDRFEYVDNRQHKHV